jgi:hypothetical protein
MLRLLTVPVFVLACGLAAGCADDEPTQAPITPPEQFTETFTGTLTVLGATIHTFTTVLPGEAQVQIESLAPDSAAVVSLIFGTWNGNNCQVVLVKDDATTSSQLIGNASTGSFCVRIADIGRLTEPTTYTIRVTHF